MAVFFGISAAILWVWIFFCVWFFRLYTRVSELNNFTATMPLPPTGWRPPADLEHPRLPRPTRLTTWFLVVVTLFNLVSVALTVVGLWVVYDTYTAQRTATALLQQEGTPIDGTALSFSKSQTKHGPRYHVSYYFMYNGKNYVRTALTDADTFALAADGQPLPVRFAPSRPEISRLPRERYEGTEWVVAAMGLNVLTTLLPLAIALKRKAVLTRGRVSAAVLIECIPGRRGKRLTYAFRTVEGEAFAIVTSCERTYEPAEVHTVIYLPDQPRALLFYPEMSSMLGAAPALIALRQRTAADSGLTL